MTTEYIRDAQDYTLQLKRQLLYRDYERGKANHVPNSTGSYLTFLLGARECGEPCGVPFPVLDLSPSIISHQEGGTGDTTTYEYTVTRTGSSIPCSVIWTVTGSTTIPGTIAATGSDFGGSFPQGVVTFGAGDTTKSLVVEVDGNTDVEDDKEFTVTLSSPTNATIGVGIALGTIDNDDP